MDHETALVVATSLLVCITAYYAWNTKRMLEEQRKAVEYLIKPIIGFDTEKSPDPFKEIRFEISGNDIYNLEATMTINGVSETKYLGCVLIKADPKIPVVSHPFDLDSILSKVKENLEATVEIRIKYQSFSGYQYEEEFTWKECDILEGAIKFKPHITQPFSRKPLNL